MWNASRSKLMILSIGICRRREHRQAYEILFKSLQQQHINRTHAETTWSENKDLKLIFKAFQWKHAHESSLIQSNILNVAVKVEKSYRERIHLWGHTVLLYVYLIVLSNEYAQLIQCKNYRLSLNGPSHSKVKNKTKHNITSNTLRNTWSC